MPKPLSPDTREGNPDIIEVLEQNIISIDNKILNFIELAKNKLTIFNPYVNFTWY